jgi:hypothetical protein
MNQSRWTLFPSVAVAIFVVASLVDCGGTESATDLGVDVETNDVRDISGDVAAYDVLDVRSDEQTTDVASTDEEITSFDVDAPNSCLTGQVCAAEFDCNQGERCNLTLVPPECQILYCAEEAEPCDPKQGDTSCAPGLVCTGSPEASCCAPDCNGKSCGLDDCGGSCGTCLGAQDLCIDYACICSVDCDGRACGEDGCGGSCGTCAIGLECNENGLCTCVVTGADDNCDGVDNDCDGLTDEDYASAPTVCGAGMCTAAGELACVNGVEIDTCQPGTPASSDAMCDNVDDDCDGETDQGFVANATTCGKGACVRTGTTKCVDGVPGDTCVPGTPAPADETCDNVDDDCDGQTDQGFVVFVTTCGKGACARTGTTECLDGVPDDTCVPGAPASSDATCDNVDDDCDGQTDQSFVATLTICGTGACARTGSTACAGGVLGDTCVPGASASSDATCDNVDDDCDGQTDEDYVAVTSCFMQGDCATGNVASSCVDGVEIACATGIPSEDDDCDGMDDDCDGLFDEAYEPDTSCFKPGPCATENVASSCWGGIETPCQTGQPEEEVCNGLDDNCDGLIDNCGCPNQYTYACIDGSCQVRPELFVDPATGLVWQRKSGGTGYWWAAESSCDNNNQGLPGSGWRLPTIGELRALVNGCSDTATGGPCGVTDSCTAYSCGSSNCGGCTLGEGPVDGLYSNVSCYAFCWSSSLYYGEAWGIDSNSGEIDLRDASPGSGGVPGDINGWSCVRAGP